MMNKMQGYYLGGESGFRLRRVFVCNTKRWSRRESNYSLTLCSVCTSFELAKEIEALAFDGTSNNSHISRLLSIGICRSGKTKVARKAARGSLAEYSRRIC